MTADAPGPPRAVVFGAYGTLLDTGALIARHGASLGAAGEAVDALWRQKQIEYCWAAALAGQEHWRDFETLTREALTVALNWNGGADGRLIATLMRAYRALPAYPEAAGALGALREAGIVTAVLSNGSRAMLDEALGAARLRPLLDEMLTTDAARTCKPDPRAYRLAEDALRCHASGIVFVSSNAWDARAAAAYGFRAVWVNRAGQPTEFALHQIVPVLADLTALPGLLSGAAGEGAVGGGAAAP